MATASNVGKNESFPTAKQSYVELLAKSNFSFLQGASHPEEMVQTAQRLGYRGLGLCDSNGLYGVVRGFKAATQLSHFDPHSEELALERERNQNFRYLLGCELTLLNEQSLTLMPMSRRGYSQLCRLITIAKRNTAKYHSSIAFHDLIQHSEDLLFFPKPPWKLDFLLELQKYVGERMYLPIYRDHTWLAEKYERQALEWEQIHKFELVATQLPLMHSPEHKPLHDCLVCIDRKVKLEEAANHLLLNRERHLKSLPELFELWKDRPDLLTKTERIASQVNFLLSDLRYRYPEGDLPPGLTARRYIRKACTQGLKRRYPQKIPRKAWRQLNYELKIIAKLSYEDYFLTLHDICKFADEKGILYQGRGSAANSIVCYTLGLTAIDPLMFSCTFERFLSEERGDPPDIDIDFEHQRREEVIQYIYTKYGASHAGMVCTVIRYRSRMALRELCKVFDISLDAVNFLVRHMGKDGMKRLLEDPPPFEHFNLSENKLQLILQLTMQLVGFPRHIGIHTGGFVISHGPLIDDVPVEKATMEGRYVVQWNKDDIDTLGMMKIDVLALGMLTALKKCLTLLKEHKGIHWSLADIPQDDPDTYDLIQKADTVGVFQIESRAQMSMLPRLKPKCFYDLVIEVAIVRPGPLQGGMVHPYLRRRQGKEEIFYHHPKLKPILEKTLGVPLFQEQVLLIPPAVAGFTRGEADELRRILSMSWRREGSMEQIRHRLTQGMRAHGISAEYTEQIYKMIEGFASYGFPESHSASFSLLTYASCYLKRHHPEIFVTSLLNSQPMGFYSPRSLIADAQRRGVKFLPLSLQFSNTDYTIENGNVRVGFHSVHGVSREYLDHLVAEREASGPFRNMTDFVHRTKPHKGALLKLAEANVFECFGMVPRQAVWWISSLDLDINSLNYARPQQSNDTLDDRVQNSEWIPQESEWQELLREYHSTGICIDNHPLKILRHRLDEQNQHLIANRWVPYTHAQGLPRLQHGQAIRTAGIICVHQRPPTAKGFNFLTLEDEYGMMNIVLKPPVYKKYRDIIRYGALLEVQGMLEFIDNVRNIQAEHLRILDPRGLMYKKVMPTPSFSI